MSQQWWIVFRCDAIASPSFASLFDMFSQILDSAICVTLFHALSQFGRGLIYDVYIPQYILLYLWCLYLYLCSKCILFIFMTFCNMFHALRQLGGGQLFPEHTMTPKSRRLNTMSTKAYTSQIYTLHSRISMCHQKVIWVVKSIGTGVLSITWYDFTVYKTKVIRLHKFWWLTGEKPSNLH